MIILISQYVEWTKKNCDDFFFQFSRTEWIIFCQQLNIDDIFWLFFPNFQYFLLVTRGYIINKAMRALLIILFLGEPNGNKRENCIQIYTTLRDQQWNDGPCNGRQGFICKKSCKYLLYLSKGCSQSNWSFFLATTLKFYPKLF